MALEDSPAYQWYVKDWRSSRAGQRMSFAERGVYREMLDEQWERRALPDDADAVAEMIATTEAQRAEVIAAWPVVRRKFVTVEGGIQNARLERCRREFKAYLREKKKGGKARAALAARDGKGTFQPSSSKPAERQQATSSPPAGIQPSSSTATATASSSATAATDARRSAGQPPLSLGLRRLKIWRWMVEECIGKLGEHAEEFDLDAWIQDVDRTEQRVISGDWGAYWATAFDAEVRRRGLPIAVSSDRKPMFTQSSKEMGEAVLANLKRETGLPR